MRRWYVAIACTALVACADQIPTGTTDLAPSLQSEGEESSNALLLATRMLPELEFPVSTSLSNGRAKIKIRRDGTIESLVIIDNESVESVRFGHIHRLLPGAQTGPIIWWLTSPVGVDLNLTERKLVFKQTAIFVTNNQFTTHDAALAELLRNPEGFYVNFHSDAFPGGFARGFLDEKNKNLDDDI